MSKCYLLGIDIGTQGTKTSLISTDGQIIAEAFEVSKLIRPAKGVVMQKPDEIYESVINTINKVMTKSRVRPLDVAAIGIDGQMAGIMAIDEDWNAVTYYDSWLDTRCEKYIKHIKSIAEDKVIRITGCPVTYAHGPKILWWKNERPEAYKKIYKFVLPSVYVAGKLAGLKGDSAYIDYTYLHFSGFGDVAHNSWSDELMYIFDIDRNKMPDIIEPWKIIGRLTKEAANKCKLVSGIPIVAGCGDSAATSLGAGITSKGLLFDVAGSASIFSCCVDQYRPDLDNKTLIFARSVIPDLWVPLAYINGGGMCLKWFRDNLTGNGNKISYAELDKFAENIIAGSEGLIFSPHFSGRVCPNNPNIRGSWLGLSWVHTRSHMYKAIMEGIAYEYSYYLKLIKNLIEGMSFSKVIAIGGGAKSRIFNSIKADVLGISYSTQAINDTATIGSAVVAGFGVGVFDTIPNAIDKFIEMVDYIEPDFEKHKLYKKYVKAYENVFEAFEPIYKLIIK